MQNKIAAIVIDKERGKHDYKKVKFNNLPNWCEKGFELSVYENAHGILKKINDLPGLDCIITVGDVPYEDEIRALPYAYRRKWSRVEKFDPDEIAYIIVNTLLLNINREIPENAETFSIFTCTFNTPKKYIERLYNSLLSQTYQNWNWWILDDSRNSETLERIKSLCDPRITILKNVTRHGNIGFNKHMIAMMCDGDYLVEVDHDDELTPDCLEKLHECYIKSGADFVYSDCLEIIDGAPIYYGEDFSYGQGYYRDEVVNGVEYKGVAITCSSINVKTVRGIHAAPNHIRTWRKDFYHKIGGHNTELSVIDDMELLIRTFLYGRMAKVDKVLYIQHQGESRENGRGDTATGGRLDEIQRINLLIKWKYEKPIHERILELGYEDPIWNEETQESDIRKKIDECVPMDLLILK